MYPPPTKFPSRPVPDTTDPHRLAKGQTRPQKPWKRIKKSKNLNNIKPASSLYIPGHKMKSCKTMQAQAKSMKATYPYACGG